MNDFKTMHLFAGHGGGLLADLILGHTPIVAVEWDGYACQVLRERAADGWFSGLRVWEGDVRLFDPSEYAGSVDCIHAGFPCQDISVAGKQAGVSEGTRSGLYREVLRIAGVVRPKYLFLENVSAILGNGLGTVLGDMAALGYDVKWLCIRASDVGAPHHRDRWFALAYANGKRGERRRECESGSTGTEQHTDGQRGIADIEAQGRSENVADTECSTVNQQHQSAMQRGQTYQAEQAGMGGSNVPHTQCQRLRGQGEHEQSIGAAQSSDWEAIGIEHGSASNFWSTEPNVGRVANGVPHLVHRLKGLGNAQVPLQAAAAWKLLGGV